MCDFDNVSINTNTNIHIDNINIQMLTCDIIIGYHAHNVLTCINMQYQEDYHKVWVIRELQKKISEYRAGRLHISLYSLLNVLKISILEVSKQYDIYCMCFYLKILYYST